MLETNRNFGLYFNISMEAMQKFFRQIVSRWIKLHQLRLETVVTLKLMGWKQTVIEELLTYNPMD